MTKQDFLKDALEYHSRAPRGKISITPTKPCLTQKDLSLAYTPGVAEPCLEIKNNPEEIWRYTNRGNTVAIVTDGTAVLGLGNIGPAAGLPVMEGKAVLFKRFADIDALPLCYDFKTDDRERLEKFFHAVKPLEPCLGAINLEDIAAPFCFDLQTKLDAAMSIPVFHDDQDGTAIIMTAGLRNALAVIGKKLAEVKIVMNGAGAAGLAIARLLLEFGVQKTQLWLCDSKGLITTGRADLNDAKRAFAQDAAASDLDKTLKDADVFIGVSVAGALKPEMISVMAADPIIFACANPVPEIMPDEALKAGAKIVATGRSDYKNQVNNSLGFPGIFRGALDTRATTVNTAMKIAASQALAELASEPPTGEILKILTRAYPKEGGTFTRSKTLSLDYIIPKQFDLRVVPRVARAVAQAAMATGVAQTPIADFDAYEQAVLERIKKQWGVS